MIRGEDFPETFSGIKAWATKYYGSYEAYHDERYKPGGLHGPRFPFTWFALVGTQLEPWLNDYRLHEPFQSNAHSWWHLQFMRGFNKFAQDAAATDPRPEPPKPTPKPDYPHPGDSVPTEEPTLPVCTPFYTGECIPPGEPEVEPEPPKPEPPTPSEPDDTVKIKLDLIYRQLMLLRSQVQRLADEVEDM
jgi:hypothetical protein